MGDKSLRVHLDPGRSNENLLQFTAELADRFEARVIGITACAPPFMACADVGVDGEAFEMERRQMEDQVGSAEAEFRAALRDRDARVEWRSAEDDADLVRYVSRQARNADLLPTAGAQGDAFVREWMPGGVTKDLLMSPHRCSLVSH